MYGTGIGFLCGPGVARRREVVLERYQPQVDLSQNQIIAAEALVRWRHPKRGVLLPGVFIPVAEDSGLIVPLGQWALEAACRQRQAWNGAGLKHFPIAVNVSGVQFQDPDFPDLVVRTLGI